MRAPAFVIAAVVLAAAVARAAPPTCECPAPGPDVPVPGTWVVSFEELFDGDALNASRWSVSNWSQVISQYDGHDALFIADRVAVADGHLAITTVLETNVFDGVTYNFTSGWLDSQQKVNRSIGRFEASIKMPNPNATGAWPAYWLLPEGNCWCVAVRAPAPRAPPNREHRAPPNRKHPHPLTATDPSPYPTGQ